MKHEQTLFEVTPNGPLKVSGPFKLKGPDGKIIDIEEPIFLCRCGNSSNKPFCDDTHMRSGFSE